MASSSSLNIILFGFMGSGKSSVAGELASSYGFTLYDIDEMIEANQEMTIADIFSKRGEKYFRTIEADFALEAGKCPGAVIATGGGLIENTFVCDCLKNNGVPFFLRAPLEVLWNRVQADKGDRPLLSTFEEFCRLYERRAFLYEQLPHVIDTDGVSVNAIATEIYRLFCS